MRQKDESKSRRSAPLSRVKHSKNATTHAESVLPDHASLLVTKSRDTYRKRLPTRSPSLQRRTNS